MRGCANSPPCPDATASGCSASGASRRTWFDGDAGAALWDTAVDLDLRIVATLLAPELPRLSTMLARHPDVPVVLDHCGFPDLRGGPSFPGWRRCSRWPDTPVCTSRSRRTSSKPRANMRRRFVEHLADTFGADRLVWGSDYPQTHDRTYAELVALGRDACAGLTASPIAARVLGGNALRLWPALAH